MDARELIKILNDDGWCFIRQEGSHYQFKHPSKTGIVTVPYHSHKDIKIGTLNSILKKAGLK